MRKLLDIILSEPVAILVLLLALAVSVGRMGREEPRDCPPTIPGSTKELVDLTCWLSEEHPEVYDEWREHGYALSN